MKNKNNEKNNTYEDKWVEVFKDDYDLVFNLMSYQTIIS